MSTGISISSINRIKELAEEKKFAEALEILDTQNLDKSINPQFLRISGEIFRENKRYYDSRKYLIKAHQMSPQGTRIIYELIRLYLELGYYTRAQKYYEQYKFYVAPEDTQQEYMEYLVKKAKGADIKEIAAVLIPILERMPDEQWNFEAILLYHKMGRKDKALEESQYILENFKESKYIQYVIDYIDDNLDVDALFYCYPKEEVPEDEELYGDLISLENTILENDYLRMYPPEARIMVEADDKDGIDGKPVKEKKKKKSGRKKEDSDTEQADSQPDVEVSESSQKSVDDEEIETENYENVSVDDKEKTKEEISDDVSEKRKKEEQRKEERELALDKILSKKVDKERIRETAKQVAQTVKEIDTAKAKTQVKNVAGVLKGNVAKATESLGEAVAAKTNSDSQSVERISEEFVDGIIEDVLEPPKKKVGQVVMNEELDALIPDSLEAMSADEIADIEAKKVEEERIELEALEASERLVEEKKDSLLRKWVRKEESDVSEEEVVVQQGVTAQTIATVSFEELKKRFLEDDREETPLDTLGFMTVVQSDVDNRMKEEIPQEAEILHQMIDNKEYYAGEDSAYFESQASYEKNDFEVEDYVFGETQQTDRKVAETSQDELFVVENIYIDKSILDFDEMIPSVDVMVLEHASEDAEYREVVMKEEPEVLTEEPETKEEPTVVTEKPETKEELTVVTEEPETKEEPEVATEEPEMKKEPELLEKEVEGATETGNIHMEEQRVEVIEVNIDETKNDKPNRVLLRNSIVLSDEMIRKLSALKESRC